MSSSVEPPSITIAPLARQPLRTQEPSGRERGDFLWHQVYQLDPSSEAYQRIAAYFKDSMGSSVPPLQNSEILRASAPCLVPR